MKDPASWMMAECIPDGFEWKDPSKVQVGEVFHLLDHWRGREDQGLQPLVWLPSSPLFVDTKQSNRHAQSIRQAAALEPQDSEEEVFVLPHSDCTVVNWVRDLRGQLSRISPHRTYFKGMQQRRS